MNKVVVFGLDGACFDLIGDWIDEGRLPTLAGLIERGGRGDLTSCVPATTPPAWSSLTTGVNPGKHGVFGFYRREPSSYDVHPVSGDDVRARRVWDYASEHDRTSLVVNVPVTHPAREIDGALVPGYLAPDDPETYPPDLLSSVGMDDYRVYAPSERDGAPDDGLLSEWLALTDSRRDLTLALQERYDWEFLFVEFQKTDGAVHKFADRSKVRRIYERVDDCMAAVLDAVEGDPNVLVVSDHGIGQPKEWSVALNTWFVEEGYATTTVGSEGKRSWKDDATDDGAGAGGGATDSTGGVAPLDRLLAGLASVGVTKQRIERTLASLGLYDLAVRLAPADVGQAVDEEVVDEAASRAFYHGIGFSGVDVGVTINDAAFYDEGTVGPDEYDALRAELIERLAALTGPDGERAFDGARPREAVYDGPYVREAPDVVLRQADDYVIGSSKPRGKTFSPADADRIDHTDTGLLVAAGPDVEADWTLEGTPSIVDVAPTLLYLLGVPCNERFDGDPLALTTLDGTPKWEAYDRLETVDRAAFSDEEREALEDRLRGMGYLE